MANREPCAIDIPENLVGLGNSAGNWDGLKNGLHNTFLAGFVKLFGARRVLTN